MQISKNMIVAIGAVLGAAGGFIAGALARQPEINKLRKQVSILQKNAVQLQEIVEEQSREIKTMLDGYKALGFFKMKQKRKLRLAIEDELVCQYASCDYLELLLDTVSTGREMSEEELRFFNEYAKMLKDDIIDDRELEVLRPMMQQRHPMELKRLQECDMQPVLKELAGYEGTKESKKFKLPFGKQEEKRSEE